MAASNICQSATWLRLARRPSTLCTIRGTSAVIAKVLVIVRTITVSQKSAGMPASSKAPTISRLVTAGATTPAITISMTTVRRRSKRRGLAQSCTMAQAPNTATAQFARYWIATRVIGASGNWTRKWNGRTASR